MSNPRKFKRVLDYGDSQWPMAEFAILMKDIVEQVPDEYRDTLKVELVHNTWPDGDSSVYLAVTVVMTDSFDYTDSGWEPAY